MTANANLPAMPVSCVDADGYITDTQSMVSGLTKREMFAMAAMQGIMANAATMPEHGGHFKNIASDAVTAADALLAELEK